MVTTITAYLAQDRCLALVRGQPLPDPTHGSALFADISGFSSLTERLTHQLGARRSSLADYENGMWARLDKMMKDCLVTGNDQTYGINRVFLTGRRFRDNVRVMLPSGRESFFPECKIEEFTKTSKSGKPYTARSFTARNPNGTREEYYGGKFADIFTQSTCADLLRHTVIECWKHGFPTMMHVHDENVSVVPRKDAQKHLETIEHLMINPGPWASGFPIAVESILCDRYLKG